MYIHMYIHKGSGLGKPNFHVGQDPGCRLSLGIYTYIYLCVYVHEHIWRYLSTIVSLNIHVYIWYVRQDPGCHHSLGGMYIYMCIYIYTYLNIYIYTCI
jgi:hypothetical protein